MGKTLLIAEKPKVANQLIKAARFRGSKRYAGTKPFYGYFENEKYIVSWCIGHLLEVMNPEDHDPVLKEFRFDNLPIIFDTEYRVKEERKEQMSILIKLLQRNDVDHVVNAADKDKEGELIFREVYEFANANKRMSRLFLSSYESAELEAALNQLKSGEEFELLADSARARQYLDHLIGITVTRGSTSKLANNAFLLTSGRIQMCLLQEIRKREIEVENFKEQIYFNLNVTTENEVNALLKIEKQCLESKPLQDLGAR